MLTRTLYDIPMEKNVVTEKLRTYTFQKTLLLLLLLPYGWAFCVHVC